jgi:uncharacterized protein
MFLEFMNPTISGIKTFTFTLVLAFCVMLNYVEAQSKEPSENNRIISIPDAPVPHRYVNDFADILTPDQEQTLENKLVEIDKDTTVQIAVVTISTTGNVQLFDYAEQLFQKWGIGQKGRNNGLLLIAAINDKNSEITYDYDLEGKVTNSAAGHILENVLKPYFKEKKYYEGLTASTDSLIQLSQGKYNSEVKSNDSNFIEEAFNYFGLFMILSIFLFMFFAMGLQICAHFSMFFNFILYLYAHIRGGTYLENYEKEQLELESNKSKGDITNFNIMSMSTWGTFYAASGSFNSGGGSSSGGSSFGGGSSGGGGASGSW